MIWKRPINRVALAALLVGALGAVGCNGAQREAPLEGVIRHDSPAPVLIEGESIKTSQALAAGQWDSPKQMYQATCAQCHDTGVGPVLFGKKPGAEYIVHVARNGRNGMPAFFPSEYSDKDLKALAEWIKEQPAPAGDQAQGGQS